MVRNSCLAGMNDDDTETFVSVLRHVDASSLVTRTAFNVTALGSCSPSVIVCDIDDLDVDPLEMIRRLRFVLPDCIIAVYTGVVGREWALACHLAGVNCLLSKESSIDGLTAGMRIALETGCFTDSHFAKTRLRAT